MPKWFNKAVITAIVTVGLMVVAAILTVAVSGEPSGNDSALQNFGTFVVFMTIAGLLGGIFLVGRLFPWKGFGDGKSSESLAENSRLKNGEAYSEVEHTCSTKIRQVGAGQTEYCGGKTVVNGRE